MKASNDSASEYSQAPAIKSELLTIRHLFDTLNIQSYFVIVRQLMQIRPAKCFRASESFCEMRDNSG